jgi:peptidoglycan/LPS O-acetylase OafA/YrhL
MATGDAAGTGVRSRDMIAALTGVRAVAAVWVVLFHFRTELVTLLPVLGPAMPFAEAGRVGVDLFFVLSGFILAYNYADAFTNFQARRYARFLWLRLARIYPVHLATLVMLLVAVLVMRTWGMSPRPAEQYAADSVLTNVLLVHAWAGMDLTWNYPAWSISAEWFAYLLFPFVALVLPKVGSPRAAVAGVLGCFAAMFTVFVVFPTHWPFPVPLVRVGGEFLAGVFLYLVFRSTLGRGRRWSGIAPLALGCLILVASGLESVGRSAIWSAPLCALVILALARGDGWLNRWLGSRGSVLLGQASYSLYMTHALCQLALVRVLPPEAIAGLGLPVRVATVLCYLAVILGTAVAVYRFVEVPSRDLMRRALDRWSRERVVTPG